MNAEELRKALKRGAHLRKGFRTFHSVDGHLCVDRKIPLPLSSVSTSLPDEDDIPIRNHKNIQLGVLCLRRQILASDMSALTEAQYAGYLADVNETSLLVVPYVLQKHYAVIDEPFYEEYKSKYMSGSPIWGGFCHDDGKISSAVRHPRTISLNAIPRVILPNRYHEATARRAIDEPRALERFLKMYHLLELSFDLKLVQQLRTLKHDLKGIGQVLSAYSSADMSRLDDLLEKCRNTNTIESCLNSIVNDSDAFDKAEVIFFKYNKKDNPFGSKDDCETKFKNLKKKNGFSVTAAKDCGLCQPAGYGAFLCRVAAFWIYRVRCSIAHNRIGEYVMTLDDEKFVAYFMEPLLREILIQVFKPGR